MESAEDYPDTASPHVSTCSVGGLCRLASQDSSYLVVHKDAPITVHNPHSVELQTSTWRIGSRSKMRNVAVINGMRRWTPYDPDSRDPDDIGGKVASAVATYRDKIFIKKPNTSEATLLGYIVDAAFSLPNETSTFFAKVAVGGDAVVYMDFRRDGDTNKKTGHKAGYLNLLGLTDTPPR